MTLQIDDSLQAFQWSPQPKTAKFVAKLVDAFLTNCPLAARLSDRMRDETGTRFGDWISEIRLNRKDARVSDLNAAGYTATRDLQTMAVFENEAGMFPPIVVWDGKFQITIKAEFVADFLAANHLELPIEGAPLSDIRQVKACDCNETTLIVMECHGLRPLDKPKPNRNPIARLTHLERFRTRQRDFDDDNQAFAHLHALIDDAIAEIGQDLTCDLFFAAEREYWQRRNRAAQVQYARQEKLGLGWANHDHHTYRCSRRYFGKLIETWQKLGFLFRERFYAGREAGWGAQVMEHPITGIVTFNDVDLTPDELTGNLAQGTLPDQDKLGTVGLWCALHGESILQAGMHHLEAQFDFDLVRAQLQADHVRSMKPFTDFTYLRQAFTDGEKWDVNPKRLERLVEQNLITAAQAKQFQERGAIGSHLETLERNDGFKGFNQQGVSEIITATDPRRAKVISA